MKDRIAATINLIAIIAAGILLMLHTQLDFPMNIVSFFVGFIAVFFMVIILIATWIKP